MNKTWEVKYKTVALPRLILHHYTLPDHVDSIRAEGLMLTSDDIGLVGPPRLWLTLEDSLIERDQRLRNIYGKNTGYRNSWLASHHTMMRVTVRIPGAWVTRYVWWLDDHPECRRIRAFRALNERWFLCFRKIPPDHIVGVTPATEPSPYSAGPDTSP
jgi:hypothetical protein